MLLQTSFNDKEVQEFLVKYPKRARWALFEALKMAGGHTRKIMRGFIERGGRNWAPLGEWTSFLASGRKAPLYNLGKLVRFRFIGGKNPRVRIGFFTSTKAGDTAFNRRERERFKAGFGLTPKMLMKRHEFGKRFRVTEQMRKKMAAIGMPMKPTTKWLIVPARPVIGAVLQEEGPKLGRYIEDKFWLKMQKISEGPRI